MPEDIYQATEPASPFRRRQARQAGSLPRSAEVNTVLLLLAALAVLTALGPRILGELSAFTVRMLSAPTPPGLGSSDLTEYCLDLLSRAALRFLIIAGPVCIILALVVVFSGMLQNGFRMSSSVLKFKFERLHLGKGLKRILSSRSSLRLLFNLAKVAGVSLVAFFSIRSILPELNRLPALPPELLFAVTGRLVLRLGLHLILVLAVWAAVDYLLLRHLHHHDLRMSTHQLRQEQRELHGSPLTRQRRARLALPSPAKLASAVLQSDLVLVDCPETAGSSGARLAVALQRCRPRPQANADSPVRLTIKGSGAVARQIHLLSRQRGLAIFNRPDLTAALARAVAVNHYVPLRLYPELTDLLREDQDDRDHRNPVVSSPVRRLRRSSAGSLST